MNSKSFPKTRSESHRDWGAFPQDIIDLVLDLLKKTSRWNREGPLLRCLNRHWSHQVDKHIVEAHPYWTRKLDEEDLNSLLKFPNLTSVDFTMFSSWRMDSSRVREFEGLGICTEKAFSLLRVCLVCERLECIPKLRQLKLGPWIEWEGTYENDKDYETFVTQCFRSLTGVRILLSDPDDSYSFKAIFPFSSMPIEEITAALYHDEITDIVNHFPHLKRAKFCTGIGVEEFISFDVQTFEELFADSDPVNSSLWSGIKSLKYQIEDISHTNALRDLVCLKELDVDFNGDNHSDALSGEDMLRALEIVFSLSLTRLAIRGTNENLCLDVYFASQDKLEDLTLELCEVSGAAILRNLPSIRKLSFQTCSVIDGTKFWEFINQSDTIEGKTLNQICELTIDEVMYDDYRLQWNQETFLHISKMKSLRKLAMFLDSGIRISELEVLAQSNTLRELDVYHCLWTLENSQNNDCLEFLGFLDVIQICFESHSSFRGLEAAVRRLEEVAPWIKIYFVVE